MPARMLFVVALGELFGMTLWFSATAAAPAIATEYRMSSGGAAWLTMAVQGGFVVGTLGSALLNLADRINARALFALGCAAGALANALIPFAPTATLVILLRFCTGAALACVYPPGLKIAAGWFRDRRGTALGVIVGALTLGSGLPHLLNWAPSGWQWPSLVWTSSVLALAGGVLVATTVSDGPYVAASSPFDPRAVGTLLRIRAVRLAVLGYLGHMWELYAMWTWIPAFAAASLTLAGEPAGRAGSAIAFVTIAAGALGCVLAGPWADRWGKARIAGGAMWISAAAAAAASLVFGASLPWLAALAVVWGFSVVADSAQFSALVSEGAPRTHVGTALTLQICAGFLLTMVSMRLLPEVAESIGWRWAFLVLVPGPVFGAVVMRRLDLAGSPTG